MILVSLWWLLTVTGRVSSSPPRALDALLQEHGFRAFVQPKTGVPYEGGAPLNLSGIQVSAMRLKSGSLLTRGVSMYREFEIPEGVITYPYVERLALLYHNLGNWSLQYYPLPPPLQGYTYLAPVVGLLAYNASDLEAYALPHLSIRASTHPIYIHFSHLIARPPPYATPPQCVFFDLNGSVTLSHMLPDHVCTTFQQGHFSVVVSRGKHRRPKIVGAVVGGLSLLLVLGVVVGWWCKYKKRSKKMHIMDMEMESDVGEGLFMAVIGTTRAPVAIGTRTHPILESGYMP